MAHPRNGRGVGAALAGCILVVVAAGPARCADGHLVYVPLPESVAGALGRDAATRARLDAVVAAHVRHGRGVGRPHGDAVVILTRPDGVPILPDLEAARRANGGRRPVVTVNELSFTFDSPLFPWSDEEVATVSRTLNDLYPVAKDVYGPPAFAITVNVRHDPTLAVAGTYNPTLNEMTLLRAEDADVVGHEMLHAFRDDAIVGLGSWEEGMARAAEVELFARLAPAYVHPFDQNHGYTYDVFYDALNRPAIGSVFGNLFAGYVSPLLRYQLAGYAWGKGIIENPRFLPGFNARLYTAILSDPTAPFTESTLKALAAEAQPVLEGEPFSAWYGRQHVLDTAPAPGYHLYQRVNQFTVDFFARDAVLGTETMQPNVPVDWALYDDRDVLLGGGADVTSADGFISFEGQAAAVLAGYTGRVKVVASASTPDGPIADTALTAAGFGRGVFGAVAHASDGIVTVMPLDDPAAAVQTDVVNGAFGVPAFAARRGRFVAAFRDPSGNATVRQFSKDASDYFVLIAPSGATADLGIAIRPSRRNVRRGSTVSYAVSLTNAGPDSASGVVATVTLPDGIDLVDLPRGCDGPMPGVVRCALVSLGPGTRVGLIVLGRVEASPRRVLSTTAVVRGNGTDPVASNDESTASIRVVGRP